MDKIKLINNIKITPLKNFFTPEGNVMHAMKSTDSGYANFGEAYFSFINNNSIKGWKKHTKMTMNIIVPIGVVKFVFFDEHESSFKEEEIGIDRYVRLTIPNGIWFAFKGMHDPNSLILNIANIPHDPSEVQKKMLDDIQYNWQY